MSIQEILGSYLSASGQHELAAQAFHATTRNDFLRLGDAAIGNCPESERTNVAWRVRLELDKPEHGGPGHAEDFEIRKEQNPVTPALTLYKAYRTNGEYVNLCSPEIGPLVRRVVGMYVAREIKLPK